MEARREAAAWVAEVACPRRGFLGAFLTGSTKWASPDDAHSPSSDVDVRVVLDDAAEPHVWHKARYRDVLLEAQAVRRSELGSVERIVAEPHLAGSLWHPVLLADPSGALAELGRAVTAEFPRRRWVEERTSRTVDLCRSWLGEVEQTERFPELVTRWLFGTSVTTLVLLAAGLRNLTVRRRYVESRALLHAHGRARDHEEMLGWLGADGLGESRARTHLHALAAAFDATAPHVDTDFRFAADLAPEARTLAIDGSLELIDAGLHREAVFWLVASFSRLLQGQRAETPDAVRSRCDASFRELLADLGIQTRADVIARAAALSARIPELEGLAKQIREATPEVVD